jgi:hypothetical protein
LSITQNYTSHTFTPKDTAGLTWNERSSSPVQEGSSEEVDEWWAVAPSPLSSDTISVGESGSSSHETVAIAIAISGANTTNPFDPANSGNPYTNTGSSGTPSVSGVSTSNANDMIIALAGYSGTSTNETAASGYTLVASQTNNTSTPAWGAAEYKIVASMQSSASATWGTTISGSDNWAMIVDAVRQIS